MTPEEDLANQVRLGEIADKQLESVRKTASEWQKGLGAVVAVVSSVLVIKGPSTIAELAPWAQGWIAGLFLAAIIIGIAAVLASLIAANGMPRRNNVQGVASAADLAAKLTKKSLAALYVAIAGTVISTALIVAAIGVSWFAPAPEKGPFVWLEFTSGTSACGTLEQGDGTSIRLSTADETSTYLVADLKSIEIRETCGTAED